MLSDYKGPSNSAQIFPFLLGEKVVAAFTDSAKLYLVVASGDAFVVGGGVEGAGPTWWRESAKDVARIIARRRSEIGDRVRELANMAGVDLSAT